MYWCIEWFRRKNQNRSDLLCQGGSARTALFHITDGLSEKPNPHGSALSGSIRSDRPFHINDGFSENRIRSDLLFARVDPPGPPFSKDTNARCVVVSLPPLGFRTRSLAKTVKLRRCAAYEGYYIASLLLLCFTNKTVDENIVFNNVARLTKGIS